MSQDKDKDEFLSIPRRGVLRGGLAGLATAMMVPGLGSCRRSGGGLAGQVSSSADGGFVGENPDVWTKDARTPDAELDAQVPQFEDADLSDAVADAQAKDADSVDAMQDTGPDSGPDGGFGEDAGPSADFPSRNIPSAPSLVSLVPTLGVLGPSDSNGVRLPPGFSSRIVARSGRTVGNTSHRWHLAPDGGATYATEDGGWIYVSNSETYGFGGVGAIRFDQMGTIMDAYSILGSTSGNCAGGKTPWHTWLSCEETTRGEVHECCPWGSQSAIVRPAMGSFKHEAVAVDPVNWHLYLTEDQSNGRFYRFVPAAMNALGFPDLSSGQLEVAVVDMSGQVTWLAVPDPEYTGSTPTRTQVPSSTEFNGGEGIWYHDGTMYFSTKGDNRVWAFDIANARMGIIYDGSGHLSGVDNVTVSCCGDVLVAEDGGSMQIVAILPNGTLKTVVQVEGQGSSEITGPAFDPSGTRLYFSSQRGTGFGGITYEITGPFHRPA